MGDSFRTAAIFLIAASPLMENRLEMKFPLVATEPLKDRKLMIRSFKGSRGINPLVFNEEKGLFLYSHRALSSRFPMLTGSTGFSFPKKLSWENPFQGFNDIVSCCVKACLYTLTD
jgi:hypothetical protein